MTASPSMFPRVATSVVAALAVSAHAVLAVAQTDPTAESDALFYEGMVQMEQGHLSEACDKLDRSLRLLRRGGTLLNLALCREANGELEVALPLFEEALDLAVRARHAGRQEVARQHIADLRSRLARSTVALPVLRVVAPRQGDTAAAWEVPNSDAGISHSGQLGAIGRVDVDPLYPGENGFLGARGVLGATFGLDDHFEVGASVLLGRDVGIEPQLTFFILGRSSLKPLLNVGAPIFFSHGGQMGVRGAAGLAWDPNRHLGFFALVGGAYFPEAPVASEVEPVARAVFLLSLGVQGRL